jgi:hypothetical protein
VSDIEYGPMGYDGQGKSREQEVAGTLRMLVLVLLALGVFWGIVGFFAIKWIAG